MPVEVSRTIGRILFDEGPVAVADIAAMLRANGRPTINVTTIQRWIREGIQGKDGDMVKLEAVRIGSRLVTSKPALDRFLSATQSF